MGSRNFDSQRIESLNKKMTGLEQNLQQMVLMMQGIQQTLFAMSQQTQVRFSVPCIPQDILQQGDDADSDESDESDEGLTL